MKPPCARWYSWAACFPILNEGGAIKSIKAGSVEINYVTGAEVATMFLADVASEGSELPWPAGYDAEALTNWSNARYLFMLDEKLQKHESLTTRSQM